MIESPELSITLRRWDIDPSDDDEIAYWTSMKTESEVHVALVSIDADGFAGDGTDLLRHFHATHRQTTADAKTIWELIQDEFVIEPANAPTSRVWDGESYREL